jgi:arylsulfatase A-like enzyme
MSAIVTPRRKAPERNRRRAAFAGATVGVLLLALVMGTPGDRSAVAAHKGKPNFLVIISDDQRADELSTMPIVKQQLIDHGIKFTNGFVSNAICCPSRTSILTGDYSHTTGVFGNQPPNGGFQFFHDRSTLPVWLHHDGYTTALFGKYMNSYEDAALNRQYIPPGWDEWFAFAESQYYDYNVNDNGTLEYYGTKPQDYSTDVLANKASSYIRNTSGPLMVFFDPAAPHAPATPGPGDKNAFANLPKWDPPSYNEASVSDKPKWLQAVKPMGVGAQRDDQQFRRGQYGTLISLDHAVGQLMSALRATGRLDNTFIIYLSDNGIEWGEHRWHTKRVPYEESIRVPFIIRYDPLTSNARTDSHLVVNIDIAPTIADLAGVSDHGAEGRSMVPLLREHDPPWRSDFLLEHMQSDPVGPPSFCGVRAQNEVYVLYATGEQELYDLQSDPYELTNLASKPGEESTLEAFRQRVKELCKPPPPGLSLSVIPTGPGSGSKHHGHQGNGNTPGGKQHSGSGTGNGSGQKTTGGGNGGSTTTPTGTPTPVPTFSPPHPRSGHDRTSGSPAALPPVSTGGVVAAPLPARPQAGWVSRMEGPVSFVLIAVGVIAFLALFALAIVPPDRIRQVLRRR